MKNHLYKLYIILLVSQFFVDSMSAQVSYDKKFLKFFKAQSFAGKINAIDTLTINNKAEIYLLVKDELNDIRKKAIEENKTDIINQFVKLDGEMFYLNKNYVKAIPIFTDLLAKNKIKSTSDSVYVIFMLKNSYLNINQLNKTVELHKILVGLQKRQPNMSIWMLTPRLSSIYYEMNLYKECLAEQLIEFKDVKNNNSLFINYCNNRGLFWSKYNNQDSAIFWFTKAKEAFYKEFSNNKLSLDNEFTIGLIEGNIGQSLMELKQFDVAIPFLKKDVLGSFNIKNYHNAGISLLELSKCYLALNKFDLSKQYLDSSNVLIKKVDDYKTNLNIIKQYALYYDKTSNYRLSIDYFKTYILVKDSLQSKDNLRELLMAQVANHVLENEAEIVESQKRIKEKNLEVDKQKTIRNALIFSGILLIIFVVFILNQFGKTKKQKLLLEIKNQQIETRNEIINKSLVEKDLLIKEVHHRVKNNLQIISSLMKLQSGKSNNNEIINALGEAQDRINSMALLHQLLYRNNQMTSLMFNEYLDSLVSQISTSFSLTKKNITINSNFIELELDLDTAIPLGLITNELLSNAYKHAFADNGGEIKIELSKLLKDTYQLKVSDNGQGLMANFDLKTNDSLGLDIVAILSEQINAELKIYNANGANFEVIFKI